MVRPLLQFGTSGGALIAMTIGASSWERANQIFSLLVYASIACGIILAALSLIFLRPIAAVLGAKGQLLEDCATYGPIILMAIPAHVLQYEFRYLLVTAEKTKLDLCVTVAATAFGQCVGDILPLVYFSCPNSSLLRLTRTGFDGKALLCICTNGSSALMSNISISVVSMLYYFQLL